MCLGRGCDGFGNTNNPDDLCEECRAKFLNMNYGVDIEDELPVEDYLEDLLRDDEFADKICGIDYKLNLDTIHEEFNE